MADRKGGDRKGLNAKSVMVMMMLVVRWAALTLSFLVALNWRMKRSARPSRTQKNKMPRQRLGPSSPSERPIHFGEGLAETAQTRQKLGVSCDLIRNKGFASITPTMVRTETKQWCGTRPKEPRQTRKQLNCFVFAFLPESPICDVGAWIGSGPGRALTKCGSCALIGGPVKPGNAPSAAAVP